MLRFFFQPFVFIKLSDPLLNQECNIFSPLVYQILNFHLCRVWFFPSSDPFLRIFFSLPFPWTELYYFVIRFCAFSVPSGFFMCSSAVMGSKAEALNFLSTFFLLPLFHPPFVQILLFHSICFFSYLSDILHKIHVGRNTPGVVDGVHIRVLKGLGEILVSLFSYYGWN